jgi:thiamine-phosphate pyrophosphorylase
VRSALQNALLYGICDLGYVRSEEAEDVSRALLAGGVGILQLRAKGHDPGALHDLSLKLRILCDEFKIPFVINDHLELALECGADGLHLGQDDGSLQEARERIGPEMLLGRSTHSLEQARQALLDKADYIGFGPLFPTPTKKGRPGIGLSKICAMQEEVGLQIPAFCIGGIKPGNLEEVKRAGARRVVIVSHLLSSPAPKEETRKILSKLL